MLNETDELKSISFETVYYKYNKPVVWFNIQAHNSQNLNVI